MDKQKQLEIHFVVTTQTFGNNCYRLEKAKG